MSRTYEALKKAEEARARRLAPVGTSEPLNPARSKGRASPVLNLDLDPSLEEDYQRLRSNLFRPGKDAPRTVMIVGSSHGEGVTTTCAILAAVLARAEVGEVVLVDANLRTPRLHELFSGVDPSRGLTDLAVNGVKPTELIQPTSVPNLSLVPAGRPHKSPSYVYQHGIEDVLAQLRAAFRCVILDSPPVGVYSDSTFLAPKVDGIVLVVRAERTKIDAAVRAKRQLEWAGGRVVGAALNGTKSYIPYAIERFL